MEATIEIANSQKRIPLHPAQTARNIRRILEHLDVPQARLSFAFVTDSRIKICNRRYLGRDRATDVLAFDLRGWSETSGARGRSPHPGRSRQKGPMEGEIIISATTARRNAKAYGVSPYRELTLYVIHGILHLAGFDDQGPRRRMKMRRKEQELMDLIFGNPRD